jgi:S1-C subfamily serine protease
MTPGAPVYTQRDIDLAVRATLQELPAPPSEAAVAYDIIKPSVVRVNRVGEDDEKRPIEEVMGTGVIIQADGTILTSLHVVAGLSGLEEITVDFYNGHKSPARVVGAQPENDLAITTATASSRWAIRSE